ncbi:MAG: type IV secretory system conjugative DNA transfer family protein, partial [Butyrivibrio sp.]|nr:type IV secretory system conjugative DNA transfer family protein [Butyrivibrio sp.]
LSKYNPYMEGCEDHERIPGRHKPLWRKKMEDEEKEKAEKRRQYREASEDVSEDVQSAETQSDTVEDYGNTNESFQTAYEEAEAAPVVTESIIDRFDNAAEDSATPGLPEAPEEEPKKAAPKRRSRFTPVMA